MNAAEFFGAMFGPLRQLAHFSGRTARAQFWPFVFLLYAAQQIGAMIAMNPFMASLQRFSDAGQSGPVPEEVRKRMVGEFFALFDHIFLFSIGAMALSFVLLSAAVTRRLHDTGRSGCWALPTAILGCSGVWLMSRIVPVFAAYANAPDKIEDFSAAFDAILPMLANNAIYLATFIALIIFCAQDGTVGENGFGPDPKNRDPAEEAERRARLAEQRFRREVARREPAKRLPPARISSDAPNER